jgi:hypothetical protein
MLTRLFRYLFLFLFVLSGLRFPQSGFAQVTGARQQIRNGYFANDFDAAGHRILNLDVSNISGFQPHAPALDTLSSSSAFFLSLSPTANAAAFKTLLSFSKSDVGLGNVDNTSDASKPVSTATQTALDIKVNANGTIVSATKTKITYDAKGLVTSGADATSADIADSTDKRYVTDAQRTVIQNTSGTNTGNQTSIVGISGTTAQFNTALTDGDFATGGGTATGTNTGDQDLSGLVPKTTTVNGHALSGNVTVTPTDLSLVIGTNVQAFDADLTIYAGITPSANVQTLLGAANFAAVRTALSLVPGTDIQAFNANLAAIAGLTSAADRLPYFTGIGTASLAIFTAAGRALIDDADAAAQRTTLGATTAGGNIFTLTNPSAITFLKIAADNTVSAESAATHRTSLGTTTVGGNIFTLTNPSAISFVKIAADNTVSTRTPLQVQTDLSLVPGTNVEAWDADLDTIAAFSSTGLAARTGSGTWAQRTVTGTANEITVTNGDGVSGNPTLSLPSALTFSGKTITGGTFASPTFTTPALGTPASGVATNLTGTAAGLTAGTVTTNANLTGDVTSSGNATTLATVAVAKGGTGTTTAFTAGSVVFAGASGVYSQNNSGLFFDTTNKRLGVGVANPLFPFQIHDGTNKNMSITGFDFGAGGISYYSHDDGNTARIPITFSGSLFYFDTGSSGFGVAAPSAKIHAVANGEQLRLGWDTSNYFKTSVSSAGAVTFDAVGASAGFAFSDPVTVTGLNTATAIRSPAVAFSSAVASPGEGTMQAFTDSTTNTWGATITGGGSNHVLAYYNGTNWTVIGK